MAPAHNSERVDWYGFDQGLAQSVAKPAYRRLLVAEPALRRAVPILIIAFSDHDGRWRPRSDRRSPPPGGCKCDARNPDRRRPSSRNALTAMRNYRNQNSPPPPRKSSTTLPSQLRFTADRFLVSDADGTIIAAFPKSPVIGRKLLATLGTTQPLTTFGAEAGVLEIALPDGDAAFATVRDLGSRRPACACYSRDAARSCCRAFRYRVDDNAVHDHRLCRPDPWLSRFIGRRRGRARRDTIYDMVRGRIDTRAQPYGRCGWRDWDIARGRIFWSHSMFDILGLTSSATPCSLSANSARSCIRTMPTSTNSRPT